MSKILKKNKFNINFHPSGAFLNTNKPKFIKFKSNHNISQDIIQKETNNKDEIIRLLKDRITVLEQRVKILENKNLDNTTQNYNNTTTSAKINTLNLSHGNPKKKLTILPNGFKLNLKLIKNKKNILNGLNMSTTCIKKNKTKSNSISSLNNSNAYYANIIEEKKNNNKKSRNFFNSIYSSETNMNNNFGFRVSNSASKNKPKRFTIIPRNKSKQKLFIDILRRTMTKCSTIDNGKFQNINEIKNENIIPKIPRKGKQHKSEIIKNSSNKLIKSLKNINLNNKNNINPENKNDFFIFNNNYKDDSCIINNDNKMINNNLLFHNIKDKLENIKIRTKNLLEFYSLEKYNNQNNNKNFYTLNNISTNINEENNIKEELNFY